VTFAAEVNDVADVVVRRLNGICFRKGQAHWWELSTVVRANTVGPVRLFPTICVAGTTKALTNLLSVSWNLETEASMCAVPVDVCCSWDQANLLFDALVEYFVGLEGVSEGQSMSGLCRLPIRRKHGRTAIDAYRIEFDFVRIPTDKQASERAFRDMTAMIIQTNYVLLAAISSHPTPSHRRLLLEQFHQDSR
jgi:hypothetical protein